MLDELPHETHPMTQLAAGILALQVGGGERTYMMSSAAIKSTRAVAINACKTHAWRQLFGRARGAVY